MFPSYEKIPAETLRSTASAPRAATARGLRPGLCTVRGARPARAAFKSNKALHATTWPSAPGTGCEPVSANGNTAASGIARVVDASKPALACVTGDKVGTKTRDDCVNGRKSTTGFARPALSGLSAGPARGGRG